MGSTVANDDPLVLLLGYLSAFFLVMLMTPQMWLNYRRGSVEGFSLAMTLLWQCASILQSGYLLSTGAATPLVVTWGLNAWTFVVCEAQFLQYRGLEACCTGEDAKAEENDREGGEESDGNRRCHVFLPAVVLLTIPCALGIGLFWWIVDVSPDWVGVLVGGVVPTVFLALGFLPQIHEIYATSSTEGLSIGITCLDLCGCACGLATVGITGFDLSAAVPFMVLIFFQLIMACLILCVYPSPGMLGHEPTTMPVEQTELDCLEEGFEIQFRSNNAPRAVSETTNHVTAAPDAAVKVQ